MAGCQIVQLAVGYELLVCAPTSTGLRIAGSKLPTQDVAGIDRQTLCQQGMEAPVGSTAVARQPEGQR